MTAPVEAFDDPEQDVEEELSIRIGEEDHLPCVVAQGHMVDGPWTLNA